MSTNIYPRVDKTSMASGLIGTLLCREQYSHFPQVSHQAHLIHIPDHILVAIFGIDSNRERIFTHQLTVFFSASTMSSSSSCVSVYPLSFHFALRASRVRASVGPFLTPLSSSRCPPTGNRGGVQLSNSLRTLRQLRYLSSSHILSLSRGSLPAASQNKS